MTHDTSTQTRPKSGRAKGMFGTALALTVALSAGAAGAAVGFTVRGGGDGPAKIKCPGGISQLGHVLNENNSIFPGDPETTIDLFVTVESDGYLVEEISLATHTGTHFDAPAHFIEGARTVDQLEAQEFVWPAYIIDVRERMAQAEQDGQSVAFQLTRGDIRRYESDNGRIPDGALVVIQTGFEDFFGTDDYFGDAPGFAGGAVQWMVDHRGISAIGSDTFGPDATSDFNFDATYTILANDRFAVPGLRNLDAMSINSDVVIAAPVRLENGSGYQVNPLACHGKNPGHGDGVYADSDD